MKKWNKLNRNLSINTVTGVESTQQCRIAICVLFLYNFDKKKKNTNKFIYFFFFNWKNPGFCALFEWNLLSRTHPDGERACLTRLFLAFCFFVASLPFGRLTMRTRSTSTHLPVYCRSHIFYRAITSRDRSGPSPISLWCQSRFLLSN